MMRSCAATRFFNVGLTVGGIQVLVLELGGESVIYLYLIDKYAHLKSKSSFTLPTSTWCLDDAISGRLLLFKLLVSALCLKVSQVMGLSRKITWVVLVQMSVAWSYEVITTSLNRGQLKL